MFVAQTYPVSEPVGELLWRLEVPIAAAFLLEYVLCLYGAPDRWATRFTPHTVLDLVAVLPTRLAVSLPGSSAAAEADFSARSESPGSFGPIVIARLFTGRCAVALNSKTVGVTNSRTVCASARTAQTAHSSSTAVFKSPISAQTGAYAVCMSAHSVLGWDMKVRCVPVKRLYSTLYIVFVINRVTAFHPDPSDPRAQFLSVYSYNHRLSCHECFGFFRSAVCLSGMRGHGPDSGNTYALRGRIHCCMSGISPEGWDTWRHQKARRKRYNSSSNSG